MPTPENSPDVPVTRAGFPAVLPPVLSGADNQIDGATHFALSLQVSASGKKSKVVIPDATSTSSAVYITKPIAVEGAKLKAYLDKKGTKIPDALGRLVEDTTISCDALYVQKDGPLLMQFAMRWDKGLIGSLTGDPDLNDFFTVDEASIRILRCKKENFEVLKTYAAQLEE